MVENLSANAGDSGDAGLIPESGRYPGVGNGNPLQFSSWKIPWTEEPGGMQSMRVTKESDMTEHTCIISCANYLN